MSFVTFLSLSLSHTIIKPHNVNDEAKISIHTTRHIRIPNTLGSSETLEKRQQQR